MVDALGFDAYSCHPRLKGNSKLHTSIVNYVNLDIDIIVEYGPGDGTLQRKVTWYCGKCSDQRHHPARDHDHAGPQARILHLALPYKGRHFVCGEVDVLSRILSRSRLEQLLIVVGDWPSWDHTEGRFIPPQNSPFMILGGINNLNSSNILLIDLVRWGDSWAGMGSYAGTLIDNHIYRCEVRRKQLMEGNLAAVCRMHLLSESSRRLHGGDACSWGWLGDSATIDYDSYTENHICPSCMIICSSFFVSLLYITLEMRARVKVTHSKCFIPSYPSTQATSESSVQICESFTHSAFIVSLSISLVPQLSLDDHQQASDP